MNGLRILILASLLFILHGEASTAIMGVKEGDEVPVLFTNATMIKRNVPDGDQTFYFTGEHKGKFVNSDGKEIDSSNYEIRDGALIIKKFSETDVGAYAKEPNTIRKKVDKTHSTMVAGPTITISIKK